MPKRPTDHQLDLFVALMGEVPLRDDKEAMSVPLVSLAKGKRTTPIEWRSSNGERYVRVTANATHGTATIWDFDVILWVISPLNEAVIKGLPVSAKFRFQPYGMLHAPLHQARGRRGRLVGTGPKLADESLVAAHAPLLGGGPRGPTHTVYDAGLPAPEGFGDVHVVVPRGVAAMGAPAAPAPAAAPRRRRLDRLGAGA